jgi:tetratricopeptide (TPR) repeat protein
MPPSDESIPSGPLPAARAAFEKGDLTGATRHVASALGEDPNRSEALSLLDEIIAAAHDPLELVPGDDLPTPSNLRAVHAHILAAQGRIPEAIDKLLEVIAERPDVLYIDWALGWLQRPEAAGKVETEKFVEFIGSLLEQYAALTAPHGGGRETLTRVPLLIQLVRRTQPADASFLNAAVAILRRIGYLDEALKLAREACSLDPGSQTAESLAATHAARNEVEQALVAFRKAQEFEPSDISVRVNMADLLVNSDRVKEALEVYTEVLELAPGDQHAEPSCYFLRFVTSGDESWRDKLLDLAQAQPDNDRAQRLAQRVTPYVGFLPDPADATTRLKKMPGERGNAASLPWLEAPSNYLAYGWLSKMDLVMARIQEPDPRLPRGRVDHILWKYSGTTPRVAVAAPDPEVSHAVARIAAQAYHLDTWCGHARRLAEHLGPARIDDLLATMVHPPSAVQTDRPAEWVFRIQVAAALVIAHLDAGWEDSVRRKALFSLAGGPMDWTVDAALVALTVLARDEDDLAADITLLFRRLRDGLPAENAFSYYPALLWCSLRLPKLPEKEIDDLKERLQKHEETRRAQRHYQQALAHVEKGELDRAIEELSESVRLDPSSAEVFKERAALALRRSDARGAIDDFTQALRLQPGMGAAHMGRGQAQLKLGRLDLAIGDFSEAARLAPWDWQPLYRRGLARAARKQHAEAIDDFTQVIRLAPEQSEAYLQRALAFTQLGQYDLAIRDYSDQIQLDPQSPLAYNFRARLYQRQGNPAAALTDLEAVTQLDPANANAHCQLAWIRSTCAQAALRDGSRAIEAATLACQLTDWKKAHCLDALAAALAEAGRFDEAVARARQALELAPDSEKPTSSLRLRTFEQRQPLREG